MTNIDMSRLISRETRRATAAELHAQRVKEECRTRIFEIADQISQTNLATACSAGRMTEEDIGSYNELLDWIGAMREACRSMAHAPGPNGADSGAWPVPPASAASIARRF
jgi:hypothetical protein